MYKRYCDVGSSHAVYAGNPNDTSVDFFSTEIGVQYKNNVVEVYCQVPGPDLSSSTSGSRWYLLTKPTAITDGNRNNAARGVGFFAAGFTVQGRNPAASDGHVPGVPFCSEPNSWTSRIDGQGSSGFNTGLYSDYNSVSRVGYDRGYYSDSSGKNVVPSNNTYSNYDNNYRYGNSAVSGGNVSGNSGNGYVSGNGYAGSYNCATGTNCYNCDSNGQNCSNCNADGTNCTSCNGANCNGYNGNRYDGNRSNFNPPANTCSNGKTSFRGKCFSSFNFQTFRPASPDKDAPIKDDNGTVTGSAPAGSYALICQSNHERSALGANETTYNRGGGQANDNIAWARMANGGWLPETFITTGANNGPLPNLADCPA